MKKGGCFALPESLTHYRRCGLVCGAVLPRTPLCLSPRGAVQTGARVQHSKRAIRTHGAALVVRHHVARTLHHGHLRKRPFALFRTGCTQNWGWWRCSSAITSGAGGSGRNSRKAPALGTRAGSVCSTRCPRCCSSQLCLWWSSRMRSRGRGCSSCWRGSGASSGSPSGLLLQGSRLIQGHKTL